MDLHRWTLLGCGAAWRGAVRRGATTATAIVAAFLAGFLAVGCGDDSGTGDPDAHVGPVCEATGGARCFYVATDGDDAHAGTIDSPFGTFAPALTQAAPGDFIYARGGTYGRDHAMVYRVVRDYDSHPATTCPDGQVLTDEYCFTDGMTMIGLTDFSGWASNTPAFTVANGTQDAPITVKAYPGENAVLDTTGFSQRAVAVGVKSHWTIQGFEIIGGMFNIGGGDAEAQPHDIIIRDNDIHDITLDGGDNPGIVRIDRGDIGGPYNIFVWRNELHGIYDEEFPDQWQDVPDAQHFGAVTTLSRETYLGYDGGGTGYIEIIGNRMYDLPQVFFFKNPMAGPVEIRDNVIFDAGRLGNMGASNVHMAGNLVVGISTGWWVVGNEGNVDPLVQAIAGQNAVIEYNTFVGLDSLLGVRCGTGHRVENNVFFGMTGETTGAGWDTPAYIAKSEAFHDALDPADSLLQEIVSDHNCFVTPTSDFQLVSRYLPPEVTGADWLVEHYDTTDGQAVFGFDANSVVILETDAVAIFTDPVAGDYSLLDPSMCPDMGLEFWSE
jgi:hypothetical protein